MRKPRKNTDTKHCPHYRRLVNKSTKFKGISCKACNFAIGFSDRLGVYWLTPNTYNCFYINTYTGGDVEHARNTYVKQHCHGKYESCKYYKNVR